MLTTRWLYMRYFSRFPLLWMCFSCSYIVLFTYVKGNASHYNLHFWLGLESTTDERGVAAYKACELDDALQGRPVQYREVQGHESVGFLKLFAASGGVVYLDGGVASGFNAVKPHEYSPRLFHVKGKRYTRVRQVPLAVTSLDAGDSFILDLGLIIIQWNGASANVHEQAKAVEVSNALRNERGARPEMVILNQNVNDAVTDPIASKFWQSLGVASAVQPSIPVKAPDSGVAAATRGSNDAFLILDHSGNLSVVPGTTTDSSKWLRASLVENAAYIVDVSSAVFVWTGSQCSAAQKNNAVRAAAARVDGPSAGSRPLWTPVTCVRSGFETADFKAIFYDWEAISAAKLREALAAPPGKSREQLDMEAAALLGGDLERLTQVRSCESAPPVLAGTQGTITTYRIENMTMVPADPTANGHFFSGDSYIVLYQYKAPSGRDEAIIYFWQGAASTTDERGASAILTAALDNQLGGNPVQVRVTQGREPGHFAALFNGAMVIHAGGVGSGFRNVQSVNTTDRDGVGLFHVKGTSQYNVRAVQVVEKAASLNSSDSFVLVTPTQVFRWHGKGASTAEREAAQTVSAAIMNFGVGGAGPTVVPAVDIQEGAEPPQFWAALGGQTAYAALSLLETVHEPRLYCISNKTGVIRVEESGAEPLTQDDLVPDDVMLLDVYEGVFVWVGSQCRSEEKTGAMDVARQYLATVGDGRPAGGFITVVKQGAEPLMFTAQFVGWDAARAAAALQGYVDPYAAKVAQLQQQNAFTVTPSWATQRQAQIAAAPVAASAAAAAPVAAPPSGATYTVQQLRQGVPGIRPDQKEKSLSESDFLATFKMDKSEFEALPKWKKDNVKKSVGLF